LGNIEASFACWRRQKTSKKGDSDAKLIHRDEDEHDRRATNERARNDVWTYSTVKEVPHDDELEQIERANVNQPRNEQHSIFLIRRRFKSRFSNRTEQTTETKLIETG
jgi:hypothetical protein